MPGKHVTLSNVVVGQAQLWTAPAPLSVPTTMVADTILLDTDYPTPWVPVGATENGIQLHVNPTVQDIDIEEQSTPAVVTKTKEDVIVQVTFSEDTTAVMKLAYGSGTLTTIAPATAQPGISQLALSDTLDVISLGFDGINAFGFFRRVYIPLTISAGQVQTNYRRAAAQRMYPAQFRAVCAPNTIIIKDMTAVATAGGQFGPQLMGQEDPELWNVRSLEQVIADEGLAA